jgi:hypothetical protein
MVTAAASAPRAHVSLSRRIGVVAASALLGLALALLLLGLAPTPSTQLTGAQFQVREGAGKVVGDALEVSGLAPNGQIVLVAALPDIPAYRYASVAFRASGLEGTQSAAVFWISRAAPKDAHPRALTPDAIRAGRVVLAGDERWRGDMITLGFVAQGPMRGPIRLEAVELQPGSIGWDEAMGVVLRNWSHLEGWGGGSVNFHVGALRSERRLTPVVLVALWVACALVVFAGAAKLFLPAPARPSWPLALLVALLAGVAVLDLRWQFELMHRAGQTLKADGRPPDSDAQRALGELRSHITDPKARVIVVSDDPVGYDTHRARYHLLPVRTSFGMDRLPTAAQARPGDYLLLLSYRGEIRYDAAAGVLATPQTTLGVELIARSPVAGALFRIRSTS